MQTDRSREVSIAEGGQPYRWLIPVWLALAVGDGERLGRRKARCAFRPGQLPAGRVECLEEALDQYVERFVAAVDDLSGRS